MARTLSWRTITKKPLSSDEIFKIVSKLDKTPDQGVALVCGAMVERRLEQAIAARMVRMKQNVYREIFDRGSLSSFHAKIRMGYALSLFGHETVVELDKIRELRNVFAHAIHPVTFSTQRIAQSCAALKLCDHRVLPWMLIYLGKRTLHDDTAISPLLNPRDRYIYNTVLLSILLQGSAMSPKRPKRGLDGYTRWYLT